MAGMKQFWLTVFGSIVGVIAGALICITFLIFLIGGLIGAALEDAGDAALTSPGRNMVLTLDLRTPRLDQPRPTYTRPRDGPSTKGRVKLNQGRERASWLAPLFTTGLPLGPEAR